MECRLSHPSHLMNQPLQEAAWPPETCSTRQSAGAAQTASCTEPGRCLPRGSEPTGGQPGPQGRAGGLLSHQQAAVASRTFRSGLECASEALCTGAEGGAPSFSQPGTPGAEQPSQRTSRSRRTRRSLAAVLPGRSCSSAAFKFVSKRCFFQRGFSSLLNSPLLECGIP